MKSRYFSFGIQISKACGDKIGLVELLDDINGVPGVVFARRLARALNDTGGGVEGYVQPGLLHMYGMLNRVFRYLIGHYTQKQHPGILPVVAERGGFPAFEGGARGEFSAFMEYFPARDMVLGKTNPQRFLEEDQQLGNRQLLAMECLLLRLSAENPAVDSFRQLFDDEELAGDSSYPDVTSTIDRLLGECPPFESMPLSLPALLRAPILASPNSLEGQIDYIRQNWASILPADLLEELVAAQEIVNEEGRVFFGGVGRPKVLRFGKGVGEFGGYDYPEYERYSRDADWMANVVMLAKMVYVWLGQLSKTYRREIHRLDQIPDEELDKLARWGFTGLWLIGIWERSSASQRIKQIAGNHDAISSAYSLYDYIIAHDLGGEGALQNLKDRCAQRGIRLASDMVPNHTGLYSKWVVEHPDWYIQLDYPPYPGYSYNGPDLSPDGRVGLWIEDGYWEKRDAAVVFKHLDRGSGRVRYIYHGNDGTSTPWNDTAQLNYLVAEVREAVINTILHVARNFPIIRFDAAMTLAKKHYQRLWFPQPGHGSGVPSRIEHGMDRTSFDAVFPVEFWREVVDRVASDAPDTLLLAEAFWLMEGYFVRTLGMHRVYNSAFMNMLKMEENAKYRQTLKNVLEFDPRILQRFVNFMNNPDERTAVEQFGKEGKYFGAAVLLVTMPGLPMFGHGQIEGFHEKYGMEYKRAYWDEPIDEHLVGRHECQIFPLMRRRHIFSGSDHFALFDFYSGSHVNEDVFAYSNRSYSGERGLVIYHNRFADTSGWIRESSAIAVKDSSGGSSLIRKTLGEALGFNPDSRHYYRFRDYSSGYSYLRSGRQLCEQGLYVELSGYQYYAFLDFGEIVDDEYGTWGALCHRLNGTGVWSLEEEVKQVRYAVQNEALREFLNKLIGLKQVGPGLAGSLESTYSAFLAALAPDRPERERAQIVARFSSEVRDALPLLTRDPFSRTVFTTFFALHHMTKIHPGESADQYDAYGLARPFEEACQCMAAGTPELPTPLPPSDWALLLHTLLSQETFFRSVAEKGRAAACANLFGDTAAMHFLQLHDSGGAEWFNKERFELLLRYLLQLAPLAPAIPSLPKAQLTQICDILVDAAKEAGYRLDRFLKILEGAHDV
ncbi:alpha-amylase [Geomonas sp. RF6]|uniref:alpha-amylase family glycosyl hydrolase n=1 Tax=Geomonas sp. RF6 TaxID=2897342 RepID=UPI001E3103BD|nr:alpha-amylase family glycosyl hydrolase [Geomonas sp. RF6]UFS71520.1 alpha-amylase [Geomonas sp. RF6]